jgi:hypothetical protein
VTQYLVMNPRFVCPALIGALIIALIGAAAAQQPAIKPSSPSVVTPPAWSRVLNMPDGRTFVTDGGLSIDAKFAKPATLPAVVLAPESAKGLAARLTLPYDKEIGLADLRSGSFKNSFMTPDGIHLNGNYVTFLRQMLPAGSRLRTKGKTDAVVIVTDGQPVGIMMPLQPPSR